MRYQRQGTLTTIALAATVLIVAVNTWLALRSISELSDSQKWVDHTWQVINSLERVSGTLKGAESATRGFLITDNESYLAPYVEAQNQLPQQISDLEKLTSDNPSQVTRLAEIRTVVQQRMGILEHAIEARRSSEYDALHLQSPSGTGKAAMDRIHTLTAEMQQEEQELLKRRMAATHASSDHAKETILVAGALDLLLVLLMFRLIVREQTLREKAELAKDRLERMQLISDVALTQLGLTDLTDELLRRVRRVIDADAAVLCMWRQDELVVEAASGIAISPGIHVPLSPDNPIHAAIQNRQVLITGESDSDCIPLDQLRSQMVTFLTIPLIATDHVIGVLIATRRRNNPFTDHEHHLVSVVADRIALSLDRADAYEAEKAARRLAEARADEVRALNAELEARVRVRTSELEIANKELEAFSYSVSHDLRAPLRTVDGFSMALQEDFADALDDKGRDFLGRIRDGVQRMGQLIDALLQLSRITRAELLREPVDVTRMASDVMRELEQQHPERKIDFQVQPGLETKADPRLLRIALENLLGNAVKFTARTPEAHILLGREEGSNTFYLKDNGAGFDMQYSEKLFTAFQRLHGDREFKGSGIGLATVARVIRRHHGSIHAEADVGKGATFRFTLD